MQLTSGDQHVSGHRVVTLNNSSDVACRIFDHTRNKSTGFCQSHPFIIWEDFSLL